MRIEQLMNGMNLSFLNLVCLLPFLFVPFFLPLLRRNSGCGVAVQCQIQPYQRWYPNTNANAKANMPTIGTGTGIANTQCTM